MPHPQNNFPYNQHLYNADEAFFTGTAAEVTPIREVDERPDPANPVYMRGASVQSLSLYCMGEFDKCCYLQKI